MATKRWFCFITMVAVAVLLLSACKSKKSRISSDGEQKDSVGVVYDDTVIYVKDHDTAYRDGFVLYPQPIYDKYVMQIRLFDTTTRTDNPSVNINLRHMMKTGSPSEKYAHPTICQTILVFC